MAKFKNVHLTAAVRHALDFWANMVQNYDENIEDEDFFDLLWRHLKRDEVAQMIRGHFSEKELKPLTEAKNNCLELDRDCIGSMLSALWNHKELRKKTRALLEMMKNRILRGLKSGEEDVRFEARFKKLCDFLGLDRLESSLLMLMYVRQETDFDDFPQDIQTSERPLYYAMCVDRSYAEVLRALGRGGRLTRYNCMSDDYWFNTREFGSYFSGMDDMALDEHYYRRTTGQTLPWDFFGRLAQEDGSILSEMLASRRNGGRLNILFYGAPGTGKTSFAKSLAAAVQCKTYELLQGERDGKNISVASRMAGLNVYNSRITGGGTLLIVDEADELLRTNAELYGGGTGDGHSEKGVINTLLDEMRTPVIWISNARAETMDESVRRRFDYSICFKSLTMAQRNAIWRNNVDRLEMTPLIGETAVARFADRYETSAGGITMVLENVKQLNPVADRVEGLVEKLMRPHCELMGRPISDGRNRPAADYSLEGLNIRGELGLDRILHAVANFQRERNEGTSGADRPRMNLLLWGPSGTGKTEYVKYLGAQLGSKVVVKMGSDLLDMYVGGTEARIRDAFAEAESEKAILFLDEIDGLLQGRNRAEHSWEVTQVNELLHQMENFSGVMVGATNFFDNLDVAVLRRFTFKLEFGYLDAAGKRAFFERMFGSSLTSEDAACLDAIPDLAPGDFRTVRQSLHYLGGEVDNALRLSELEKESRVKRVGRVRAQLGFRAA